MRVERTCEVCNCHNHAHGGCTERGHGKDCHGVHTMYMCNHDCCPCGKSTDTGQEEK